ESLPSSPSKQAKLRELNAKIQALQISQISPQDFAIYLKESTEGNKISPKISSELSRLIKRRKRVQEIEGTELFYALDNYTEAVKKMLFKNDEQRKLDYQNHRLKILERMARLELSRENWQEVKITKSIAPVYLRNLLKP